MRSKILALCLKLVNLANMDDKSKPSQHLRIDYAQLVNQCVVNLTISKQNKKTHQQQLDSLIH